LAVQQFHRQAQEVATDERADAALRPWLVDTAGATYELRALLPETPGGICVLFFYGGAADSRSQNALRLLSLYARALSDGTKIAGVCADSSRSIEEFRVRLDLPFPSFSDLGLDASRFYVGLRSNERGRSMPRLGLVALDADGRVLARMAADAVADGGAADRVLHSLAASTERVGGAAMAALSLVNACQLSRGGGMGVSAFLEALGVDCRAVERSAFDAIGLAPLRSPLRGGLNLRERRVVLVLSSDVALAKALIAMLLILGHATAYAARPRDADVLGEELILWRIEAGRAPIVLVADGTHYEHARVIVTHVTSPDMRDLANVVAEAAERGRSPPRASLQP
jgi:peroxiredoxin